MASKTKIYKGQKTKKDIRYFDPAALKVVEDENDPRFDPRSKRPIDEAMVRSIMAKGVIQPLTVYADGDDAYVEIGHQRRINAIEANKRLMKASKEPVLVPCLLRKEDDTGVLVVRAMENNIRSGDSIVERAKAMQQLESKGASVKDLAVTFGCTEQTVRNTLDLLDCDAKVQKKVVSGELPAIAAAKLSKLPREEQVKRLDEMLKTGAVRGKRATVAAKTGVDAGKIPKMARRDFIEGWRSEIKKTAGERDRFSVDEVLILIDVILGKKKIEKLTESSTLLDAARAAQEK